MRLPKFVKDATGYCYPATPQLAANPAMTPWNGPVGRNGFAVPVPSPPPAWLGQVVVCVASGPSLTQADCDAVSHLRTVAVNSSWRRAPHASIAFGMDEGWWEHNGAEVPLGMDRWTSSATTAARFDLHLMAARAKVSNSGAMAIDLADQLGAARILLLGYDCSVHRGTHWHGNHTKTGNPDEAATHRWQAEFEAVAEAVQAPVINCSRETALTCFPRLTLEQALCLQ